MQQNRRKHGSALLLGWASIQCTRFNINRYLICIKTDTIAVFSSSMRSFLARAAKLSLKGDPAGRRRLGAACRSLVIMPSDNFDIIGIVV